MIEHQRINLRPMTEEDMPFMVTWRNHPDSRKWFFSQEIITLEGQKQWFKKTCEKSDERFFIIQNKDSDPVGTVSIYHIETAQRSAEYGRMLIAPEHRGMGYARDATIAVLKYAFEELPVDRVSLEVMVQNEKAVKLYGSIGFSEMGSYEKEVDKKYYSILVMEIRKSTFQNRTRAHPGS